MADPDEQTLLLCEDDGTLLGHEQRDRCHAGDGLMHRAVFLVLTDSDGRVLLQRRRAMLWDGVWDLAGATHPLASPQGDESDAQAAARCARTEWGLELELVERFAFTYFERDGAHAEREYCVVFTGVVTAQLAPNPDHVGATAWETWAAIARHMDEQPEHFTPWALAVRPMLDEHPAWITPSE